MTRNNVQNGTHSTFMVFLAHQIRLLARVVAHREAEVRHEGVFLFTVGEWIGRKM